MCFCLNQSSKTRSILTAKTHHDHPQLSCEILGALRLYLTRTTKFRGGVCFRSPTHSRHTPPKSFALPHIDRPSPQQTNTTPQPFRKLLPLHLPRRDRQNHPLLLITPRINLVSIEHQEHLDRRMTNPLIPINKQMVQNYREPQRRRLLNQTRI